MKIKKKEFNKALDGAFDEGYQAGYRAGLQFAIDHPEFAKAKEALFNAAKAIAETIGGADK